MADVIKESQIMLAICGCSWASDFDSADYTSTEVTTNPQLWQYNLDLILLT